MSGDAILIVDDSPQNAKLARVLLEGEGYEVRVAISAEDALEILETFSPALVLMDIQLPGMDGLELTRRLKADPKNQFRVVALTAYAMRGDDTRALAAGCDGYITKPLDVASFATTIANYLSAPKS